MSTTNFGLVSETTFAEKMDALTAVVGRLSDGANVTSWSQVQALVRAGLASKAFAIGDQLICKKGGENGTTLFWDVIGFDHDTPVNAQLPHSMTLQLHDVYYNELLSFDNREAFYCAANALSPGTYYFNVGESTLQFTTTVQIPAGGQIVFNKSTTPVAGDTVSTYSDSSSTTALETLTMTAPENTTGTSLGTLNDTKQSNMNSIKRALIGNNNYKESAIRHWLNSNASAGNAWTPQNKWDRPPAWKNTLAGWMNDLDADFVAAVGEVTKKTVNNIVCDGGGDGYSTTPDKFFLLGKEEVFALREINSIEEGTVYPYYSVYSNLNPKTASNDADANRIKYKNGVPSNYWLRTPISNTTHTARIITDTGAIGTNNTTNVLGLAIACNIV